MKKNVVVCLSTMGYGPNALVLEIGAVRLGSKKHFHRKLSLQPQLDIGASVTEEQINFWRRAPVTADLAITPETAIDDLTQWMLSDGQIENLWVESSSFGVIGGLFQKYMDRRIPWLPITMSIETALLFKKTEQIQKPENYQYNPLDRARYRADQIKIFLEHLSSYEMIEWTEHRDDDCFDCTGNCGGEDCGIGTFLEE